MKLQIYFTTLIVLGLVALSSTCQAEDYTLQDEYKLKTILSDSRYPPVKVEPALQDSDFNFLEWLNSLLPDFGEVDEEENIESDSSSWILSFVKFLRDSWDLVVEVFKFAFWIGALYLVYRVLRTILPLLLKGSSSSEAKEIIHTKEIEEPIDIKGVTSPLLRLKLLRDLIRSNLSRKHLVPLSKTDREFSTFIDSSKHGLELKTFKLHERAVYSGKTPPDFEISELTQAYLDE